MAIETVLALLCVVSACSIFLGYAAGYGQGKQVGARRVAKYMSAVLDRMDERANRG